MNPQWKIIMFFPTITEKKDITIRRINDVKNSKSKFPPNDGFLLPLGGTY